MSESGREISMEQAQEGMVLAQALSAASGAVLLALLQRYRQGSSA